MPLRLNRRLEDRVRELCEQTIAEKDPKKMRSILIELRDTLHKHIGRIRERLADYPVAIDRRNRKS